MISSTPLAFEGAVVRPAQPHERILASLSDRAKRHPAARHSPLPHPRPPNGRTLGRRTRPSGPTGAPADDQAPTSLPAAARNAVFRILLNSGLLEEVLAPAEHHDLGWRQEIDGWIALRITEAGRKAIGTAPESGTVAADEAPAAAQAPGDRREVAAPEGPAQDAGEGSVTASTATTAGLTLREAATALLVAWPGTPEPSALPYPPPWRPCAALVGRRSQGRAGRDPMLPRPPHAGTKQQPVLALLRRSEGATIAQVMRHRLGPAHGPGLPGRAEEGSHGRGAGPGAPGRAGVAGSEGELLDSSGRWGAGLMARVSHAQPRYAVVLYRV
jgi:hypothetical protein